MKIEGTIAIIMNLIAYHGFIFIIKLILPLLYNFSYYDPIMNFHLIIHFIIIIYLYISKSNFHFYYYFPLYYCFDLLIFNINSYYCFI